MGSSESLPRVTESTESERGALGVIIIQPVMLWLFVPVLCTDLTACPPALHPRASEALELHAGDTAVHIHVQDM